MPIQQHPLPQDISSYKFRLIGDMTIKQFLYIAGFVILTILTHQSPIPFFFRYPLEILFLGLGIGLAFVPVQGRPLDQWIIAFIKSIYSPTQYTWQQTKRPAADIEPASSTQKLAPKSPTPLPTSTTTIDLSPNQTPKQQLGTARPPQHAKLTSSVKLSSSVNHNPTTPTKKADQSVNTPKIPPVTPSKPSFPSSNPQRNSTTAPSTNLPIPFTPDQPNTIVGLTLNPQGLILAGVLVEIIANGLTIRATKSNQLGQFLFAKALENGLYQIKTDKEGFKFTTYSINLKGEIVKPLKIQAKS